MRTRGWTSEWSEAVAVAGFIAKAGVKEVGGSFEASLTLDNNNYQVLLYLIVNC